MRDYPDCPICGCSAEVNQVDHEPEYACGHFLDYANPWFHPDDLIADLERASTHTARLNSPVGGSGMFYFAPTQHDLLVAALSDQRQRRDDCRAADDVAMLLHDLHTGAWVRDVLTGIAYTARRYPDVIIRRFWADLSVLVYRVTMLDIQDCIGDVVEDGYALVFEGPTYYLLPPDGNMHYSIERPWAAWLLDVYPELFCAVEAACRDYAARSNGRVACYPHENLDIVFLAVPPKR